MWWKRYDVSIWRDSLVLSQQKGIVWRKTFWRNRTNFGNHLISSNFVRKIIIAINLSWQQQHQSEATLSLCKKTFKLFHQEISDIKS